MFYTQITANRSNLQAPAVQPTDQEKKTDESKPANKNAGVQDNVTVYTAGSMNVQNPQSPDSKGVLINDLNKSMLSGSRGDMINVKLKIIGDPEFIKQDDLFYNPENNPQQRVERHVDPRTNSIAYDAGEVFCKLAFKTPRDFDPNKGLMDFGKVETSVFSGIYRLITVENEFTRGQFSQNLTLVRLFNQPDFDTLAGKAHVNDSTAANRSIQPKTVAENQNASNEIAEWDTTPAPVPVQTAQADETDFSEFGNEPPSQTVAYSEFGDDSEYQVKSEQAELRLNLAQAETVNLDEDVA
jgi:hypothetical protein